jgi:hypothetical protein
MFRQRLLDGEFGQMYHNDDIILANQWPYVECLTDGRAAISVGLPHPVTI